MKYEDLTPWDAMRLICEEGVKDVSRQWDDERWGLVYRYHNFNPNACYRRPLPPKTKRVPMKHLPPVGSAVRGNPYGKEVNFMVIRRDKYKVIIMFDTGRLESLHPLDLLEGRFEYSLPTDIHNIGGDKEGTRTWRPCWEEVEE